MIKSGDIIKFNNKQVTIETHWCQGKHRVYKTTTGELLFNLDHDIEQGKATIITSQVENVTPAIKSVFNFNKIKSDISEAS